MRQAILFLAMIMILGVLCSSFVFADVNIFYGGTSNKDIDGSVLTGSGKLNMTLYGWSHKWGDDDNRFYTNNESLGFSTGSFPTPYVKDYTMYFMTMASLQGVSKSLSGIPAEGWKVAAWVFLEREGMAMTRVSETDGGSAPQARIGGDLADGCGGKFHLGYNDSSIAQCSSSDVITGSWVYILHNVTGMIDYVYIGNKPDNITFEKSFSLNIAPVYLGSWTQGGTFTNVSFADLTIWNGTGELYSFSIPVLSNYNCTSCNPPYGDNESPYTTSDTTPTFSFDTDVIANCRIADEDWNHTTMGESRNCTTGQGNTSHKCTLTAQDELTSSTDYVYISCAHAYNGMESANSSSGALEMEITNLGDTTTTAIDNGIQNSVIWPGATVYSDQQVYLRDLSDNQVLATVDRVAVYGNQRWVLNYALANESTLGLFNITPVVYVLDMTNISSTEIKNKVSALINTTKS